MLHLQIMFIGIFPTPHSILIGLWGLFLFPAVVKRFIKGDSIIVKNKHGVTTKSIRQEIQDQMESWISNANTRKLREK